MTSRSFSYQFILIAAALIFSQNLSAQGEYMWDKEHKCKCFTLMKNGPDKYFTYTGSCKDGYVSGKATVTIFVDNEKWSIYSGNFERGFLNGQGTFEFVDAYKYEGAFEETRQHGKGKISDLRTHDMIEANFINDEISGNVKITYANGDSYSGAVRQKQWSIKEGKGSYNFKNGDRYEGDFVTDKSQNGTMYYKNGTTAKGKLLGEEHSYSFTPATAIAANSGAAEKNEDLETKRFKRGHFGDYEYNRIKGWEKPKNAEDAISYLRQYLDLRNDIVIPLAKENGNVTALGVIYVDETNPEIRLGYLTNCNIPEKKFGIEGEEYVIDKKSNRALVTLVMPLSELNNITLSKDNSGFTKVGLLGNTMVDMSLYGRSGEDKLDDTLYFYFPDDKVKFITNLMSIAGNELSKSYKESVAKENQDKIRKLTSAFSSVNEAKMFLVHNFVDGQTSDDKYYFSLRYKENGMDMLFYEDASKNKYVKTVFVPWSAISSSSAYVDKEERYKGIPGTKNPDLNKGSLGIYLKKTAGITFPGTYGSGISIYFDGKVDWITRNYNKIPIALEYLEMYAK